MEELKTQPEETVGEPKIRFLDKIRIHKWKILGGVLGIFVFAGTVFGAYKFGQRSIYPEPVEGPTPTPLPSEVSTKEGDETANWETYRDHQLKYEFRYPPDPLEPSRFEGDTSFVVGYPIKEEYRNDPFIAKSADKAFGITLGYISQTQLNVMGVTYCGAYPDDTSRCESIKIGGVDSAVDWGIVIPITRITEEGGEEQDTQIKASAWIPHPNGGVVTFELQPVVPESKEVFYQMLSTFRFLEEGATSPAPTSTPASKTYQDQEIGYSLTYPSDWAFKKTYGKDIPKVGQTDVINGIEIYKPNQPFTFVLNVIDTRRTTSVVDWWNQYSPNRLSPEEKIDRPNFSFKGNDAVKRSKTPGGSPPSRVMDEIHFLWKDYIYFLSLSYSPYELSKELLDIAYSLELP